MDVETNDDIMMKIDLMMLGLLVYVLQSTFIIQIASNLICTLFMIKVMAQNDFGHFAFKMTAMEEGTIVTAVDFVIINFHIHCNEINFHSYIINKFVFGFAKCIFAYYLIFSPCKSMLHYRYLATTLLLTIPMMRSSWEPEGRGSEQRLDWPTKDSRPLASPSSSQLAHTLWQRKYVSNTL